MHRLTDFIERHKYGIIITLMIHVGVFVYFQIATYEEVVLYEAWDFQGKNVESPDDIQITPDQIQTPQEQELFKPQEKVSSFVKNQNEKRETSYEKDIKYTSTEGSAESIEDEFFESLKNEVLGQKETRDSKNEANDNIQTEKNKAENQKKNSSKTGSEKAISGQTMVSYKLDNRHPLNRNDWYVRNPGYTCGDVDGVVKVLIEVAQSGDVIDAKVIEAQTQNATTCMLEKAKEYALKSRFNYDGGANKKQQGVITYRFVFRN